jgi:uncharacterized protein
VAVRRAREVLLDTYLISLDDDLLASAAQLASASLRSLDAIHVAAAQRVRERLAAFVTYDQRMGRAAADLGLIVAAPGA